MPDLILHSFRRCPFAMRVRMVLEEKNLTYTVLEEDLSLPSAELLRLHPEGRVPLLIHGEQVIYESSVITEYLDEVYPTPRLMPESSAERAQVRLWTYWCNTAFKVDLDAFKYEWRNMDEEARTDLQNRLARHLSKMEQALNPSAFLMGRDLTLADIHLFPFYRQLQKAQPFFHELFKLPRLNDWLERLTARPSFEQVMKIRVNV